VGVSRTIRPADTELGSDESGHRSPAAHDPHRPGRTDGRSDCGTLDAVRATRDNDVVAIAAFILSAIAIVISGVSVWYVRQQTDSQKAVEKIERRRHHAERTPALTANPVNTLHDNLAEHLARGCPEFRGTSVAAR